MAVIVYRVPYRRTENEITLGCAWLVANGLDPVRIPASTFRVISKEDGTWVAEYKEAITFADGSFVTTPEGIALTPLLHKEVSELPIELKHWWARFEI